MSARCISIDVRVRFTSPIAVVCGPSTVDHCAASRATRPASVSRYFQRRSSIRFGNLPAISIRNVTGDLKMKTRLLPILFIILICSCCNKPAVDDKQIGTSDSIARKIISSDKHNIDNNVLLEARIVKGDVFQPEEFLIALSDDTIHANYSGHLSTGELNKNIDFDKYFYTRKIHYFESDKHVIIFFEITNDDGSYNTVYCLNKNDLSTVWQTKLFSFNLTVGKAEKHTLYLGAGENAYALDIKTGQLLWQTEGLYHQHGFNFFDTIEITNSAILLTGKSFSKDDGGRMMTVGLDKRDGRILSLK